MVRVWRTMVAAAAFFCMGTVGAAAADAAILPPKGVEAVSPAADQVVLSWQPGDASPRVRYFIYRDGKRVGASDDTSFTDDWLIGGHLYEYVIRASNGTGDIAESEPVRVETQDAGEYELDPYLQRLTPTSVSVMWQTFELEATGLDYGPGRDPSREVTRDLTPTFRHLVRLNDLRPGTTYTYRWISGGVTGTRTFRTPPADPGRFSFDAIGDFGTGSAASRTNIKRINEGNANLAITVGDNAYPTGTSSQYAGYVFEPLAPFMGHRPFWPAVGNHDYYGINNYKRFFDFPGGHLYYRFRYGNVLFVMLDSNRFGPQQKRWARASLRNSDARCKVVVFHHPIWSSGLGKANDTRKARRRTFEPLLQQGGADLVLNGHIHNYERTKPLWNGKVSRRRGITYVVTGGGGAELGGFKTVKPPKWSAFRGAYYQRLRVEYTGRALQGSSIDVTGKVRDRFRARCR